jgi:hypothetical protein
MSLTLKMMWLTLHARSTKDIGNREREDYSTTANVSYTVSIQTPLSGVLEFWGLHT